MAEWYNRSVVMIVRGQSPREVPGENPREDINTTNLGASLGETLQEMSATSVGRMIAFREIIMRNVLRLGNSATNAEATTHLRKLLLAREGTGGIS